MKKEVQSPEPGARRGPRGGQPDTAILAAARQVFGAHGYQGASIRRIAQTAGVDSKLVHYYFGSKEELFAAAVADAFTTLGLPTLLFSPTDTEASPGTAYVHAALNAIENPELGPSYLALLRAVGTHEPSRQLLLHVAREVFLPQLVAHLPGPHATVRAGLLGAQMLGLLTSRYILGMSPLAELPIPQVAALVGPTLDHYLTGKLPGLDGERPDQRPHRATRPKDHP
ncbi:TetR family transcriptional regulator [Buchananella hordeovulneris]|uniref:HTH tetR-type domain-containing protein n=1 Tax=Buchananella hordeovulneris TaxID=52770 RepID=A0A1Q5PWY2_9ACTO|nr:TetR family transcriptional regulator [Buchananella hordeovulneris]OKL52067.1 hypothetical protein BSZ40_03890 [Buchananella hordeovulneris]RRD45001.1 TetR/AcrR family transcriptional regulator [Buchananella hordeovulneris]RRD51843.1 TetR/AcrR family transcriptional regulator [Buchananella hordeovulneris]